MELKSISMAIFSALILGVAANASAVIIVNGDTVHSKGEMVNVVRAVNISSSSQAANLGQVRSERLKVDGAKSNLVEFTIELNDCDSQMFAGTGIVFSGPTVTGKTDVLALQGSAAGFATNVGVQITDHTDKVIPLDGIAGPTLILTDGVNKIPFQVVHYVTGQVTAGIANADTTFKVQYQ